MFLIRFFDSFFEEEEEEEEEDAVEKTEIRVGFKWISFGMMRVGRSLEKKIFNSLRSFFISGI